jgi:hypothetical protein
VLRAVSAMWVHGNCYLTASGPLHPTWDERCNWAFVEA